MDFLRFFIKPIMLFNQDDGQGGGGGEPVKKEEPRTFNQDEVNGIVGERVARERTRIYTILGVKDEEELKEVATKVTTLETENATLTEKVTKFETEQKTAEKRNQLTEAGIDSDFVDIALLKWNPAEQKIEDFVKENPKLTKTYFEDKDFKGTGGSLDGQGGSGKVDETKMTTEEFMEYHRKNDAEKNK